MAPYYFRLKDNGANVFRVSEDARSQRLDMVQIAQVNLRSGEIKPHGQQALSAHDMVAIHRWLQEQKQRKEAEQAAYLQRAAEHISQTAHWVQSQSTEKQILEQSDELLIALHDLKSVLIRKTLEAKRSQSDA